MAAGAMNERNLFGLCALFLSRVRRGCAPVEGETPQLAGASIGGGFTRTNQDGERVAYTDLAGRYRLVYFGFTYCPDVCPVDLQIIGQALRQLEQNHPEVAARVQPIFISVDPERDTPPVLKEYVAAFHPRLVGLTGTPEEIADVANRYGVSYMKDEVEGASDYLVNHSRIADRKSTRLNSSH